jgi:hypothetical protein
MVAYKLALSHNSAPLRHPTMSNVKLLSGKLDPDLAHLSGAIACNPADSESS